MRNHIRYCLVLLGLFVAACDASTVWVTLTVRSSHENDRIWISYAIGGDQSTSSPYPFVGNSWTAVKMAERGDTVSLKALADEGTVEVSACASGEGCCVDSDFPGQWAACSIFIDGIESSFAIARSDRSDDPSVSRRRVGTRL